MQVARMNLIDWHRIGQQPFARLVRTRQVEDGVIGRCQAWAAEHYDEHNPVRSMVRLSGLAERTFKRRFVHATGMSPLHYVHSIRLEEAKQMLETSDDPVETIAHEVGYQDAVFFNRLFSGRFFFLNQSLPASAKNHLSPFGGIKIGRSPTHPVSSSGD